MSLRLKAWMIASGTLIPATFSAPVVAQSTRIQVDIPAGDLGPALSAFAARAGVLLTFDAALTRGRTTQGVRGNYTVDEGFAALLAGTGLERVTAPGGVNTLRAGSQDASPNRASTLSRIVVEGEGD